jgi:hypothetical protein
MEERMPAHGCPRMFDGGVTKLLGVDRDELERIMAIGLGHGGWTVSGRSAREKTPQDSSDQTLA